MIVLAVLGAGLTFLGYNVSLQTLTVTSTQPFTTTSMRTITSVSTETHVMTTSGGESILSGSYDIQGEGKTGWYCYSRHFHMELDAGQVHVAYDSANGPVDFWFMNENQWMQYDAKRTCDQLREVSGIAHSFGPWHYETTVTIPSSGTYHVVFLNKNKQDLSITVNVDTVAQQTVVTKTEKHTYYSTEQSPFTTEAVTAGTQRAQFGVLFYGGIGLVVIAVVVLALSTMRRKAGPGPTLAPPPGPRITTVAPPPSATGQGSEGKFCIDCGAPLSARASFCNKCGTKQ